MNSKSHVKRNKDKGNILEKYFKSFFHSVDGFVYSLKNEQNVIVMLLASIFVIILGIIFNINPLEWMFCVIAIGTVIASEMINTSIEAIVDLITLEKNPLAKIAKDTASASSLILSIMALVIGMIIFLPKIIILF
ncbi:MAG: diacylglycerol kinase family protein [Bacilli bacterium]|nr:diacylglycerol kinase family protein [Bacilli bacterium]